MFTYTRLFPIPLSGVYETPGGTILLMAHRGIESICLDRGESHMKVRDDGLVLD